jgi:hypothetical protein
MCLIKLIVRQVVDELNWPLLTSGRYSEVVVQTGLIDFLSIDFVPGHPSPQITWRKQVRHEHDRAKIRLRDKLNRDFFGEL